MVHGGLANNLAVELEYIDSEQLERGRTPAQLSGLDAILVPGGFGDRGVEGKIQAICYARENTVPFFGICLGMQLAVIEYARNLCGVKGASSTEFQKDCPQPIIDLMPDQRGVKDKGGTMRLGAYPCVLKPGSRAAQLYGQEKISERHRHRYEFNNDYREVVTRAGLSLERHEPRRSARRNRRARAPSVLRRLPVPPRVRRAGRWRRIRSSRGSWRRRPSAATSSPSGREKVSPPKPASIDVTPRRKPGILRAGFPAATVLEIELDEVSPLGSFGALAFDRGLRLEQHGSSCVAR